MAEKIDLKGSKLPELEGTPKEREIKLKEINDLADALKEDKHKRKSIYKKRYDFYVGNQEGYTTIYGKASGIKTGHPTAVFNYAGKAAQKIAYGLANNPPMVTIPARNRVREDYIEDERNRSQGVEEFVDDVFSRNLFWKKAYRRSCFNQVIMADAAVKCYPVKIEDEWDIKLFSHEKMENVMVAWRGDDPTEFDAVIVEEKRSLKSIEDEFGIVIPEKLAINEEEEKKAQTDDNWQNGEMWKNRKGGELSDGESKAPSVILREYDDEGYYCLMINDQFIEYSIKDNITYPKMKFWTFIHNIPQPRSPWSISDIDYLIQPQIEFNEANNEERSYIRVGAAQRYVAYNMNDFDPESVKTGSGGVIFVDSPDNSSRFEPLQTNVNVFPVDQYLNRVQQTIFDLGVPKVTYGSGGADSGRSKAIDYQSLVELIDFKQDSWELALTQIINKIQYLGDFYFGNKDINEDTDQIEEGINIFKDPETGEFVIRMPRFDWAEVQPVTQADKIVNVLNKVTMGLPFRYAFQEMGYDDVEEVLAEMKREAKDPDLMAYRAKMYEVTQGLVGAQMRAQAMMQSMAAPPPMAGATGGTPAINQAAPTMLPAQGGEGAAQPMAQRGGTTSFSSPKGFINKTRQNLQAAGRG